eukprot:TRINITY_DN1157_c0_g1_i6.p1 TRINITY_DN1157_c0_g1~~TRINITY_DN1157_c0_g1_i6.p1  ORF type:complete len:193 (-),score=-18.86 TRINITY_DN1157_c0_g1_i6:78-656(-)
MCLKIAIYIHCNLVKSSIIVTISVMYLYIKIKKLHPGSCCIAIYQKKRFTWSLVLHLNFIFIQYIQQYQINQFANKYIECLQQWQFKFEQWQFKFDYKIVQDSVVDCVQLEMVYNYLTDSSLLIQGIQQRSRFFLTSVIQLCQELGQLYLKNTANIWVARWRKMCSDNCVGITPIVFREQLDVTYVANVMVL